MIYANTASVGMISEKNESLLAEFLKNYKDNSFYLEDYSLANQKKHKCKDLIAKILGANSENIMFTSSTSEALSLIAAQLDIPLGSTIAIPKNCFPSIQVLINTFTKNGYHTVEIGNEFGFISLEEIEESKPSILILEWVNYWSGYKNNIKEISEFCEKNNILCIVDAIQGFGAVEIDFNIQKIDAFICSSHKWIRALEGACFSVISDKLNMKLNQKFFGYASFEDKNNFDLKNRSLSQKVERLEIGTLSTISFLSFYNALVELIENKYTTIAKVISYNTTCILKVIQKYNSIIYTPLDENRRAGILSFNIKGKEPLFVYENLIKEKIISKIRNNAIRISPNASVDIQKFCQQLEKCLMRMS